MEGFETILYEKRGGVALVTLNRPEVLNTYNIRMRDDLHQVFSAVRDDDEIKVVVLQGSGEKAFCAGADLRDFLTAPPPPAARRSRWYRDVWGLMLTVPQPLIAALHGYVLGSGLEMALFCDIRLAADDARFGLPEVGLGIIPAAGGTQTVPRSVSPGQALEMLLTNQWITAEEAYRIRLVNRILPRSGLHQATMAMAVEIAGRDARCVQAIKQAVTRGLDLPLPAGLALERRLARR